MIIKAFTKEEIIQALTAGQLVDKLGDKFIPFVSLRDKGIPTAGSPTAPLNKLNQSELSKQMSGITLHRNGDFTIYTDIANIRFWIKPDYALLWLAQNDK